MLAEHFPETAAAQPELLAHHYTEAGEHGIAVAYWQRAGQRALPHSANQELIAHLRRGLTLLTRLPATPTRLQQKLDLLVALGPALIATKGYGDPEAEGVYARVRELCEHLGDTRS